MSFPVEQAIFTSLRGDRLAGYQLASRSPGINDALAQQLSNWGPAHDALETRLAGATSINVHPLGDELVCLSFTQLAGSEYSGRGGGRVYTHSFVVRTEALLPFQGNPFTVLRAFRSAGRTQPRREPPETLESFDLVGRATGRLTSQPLRSNLLSESQCEKLVGALSVGQPVYVAGTGPLDDVLEGALQLLAEEERGRVSLSTALRLSPRRPFQLQGVFDDPALIRQLHRQENVLVLQLANDNGTPARDTKSISRTQSCNP